MDKQSLVWDTGLIETTELENSIDQASQGPYSGETHQESRGAHAREDFPDRIEYGSTLVRGSQELAKRN